jgi:uncharacterized protein YjbI with pentapeptide repeats
MNKNKLDNLTKADLRGADLKGIINFDGAILYHVNGARIEATIVNFKERMSYEL